MIGDPYATVEELEAVAGPDDGSFATLLDAASRRVEAFTGRQFNQTDQASPRRFRAVDPQRLPVDDFHTLDGLLVETNGTPWESDQVDPRPWDGVVNGQPGWPFFDLFAVGRTWAWSRTANVTVTAKWGWAAVPSGIKQATLDVAEGLKVGIQSGIIKSENLGDHQKSYWSPDVTGIVLGYPPEFDFAAPYRRLRFGVA